MSQAQLLLAQQAAYEQAMNDWLINHWLQQNQARYAESVAMAMREERVRRSVREDSDRIRVRERRRVVAVTPRVAPPVTQVTPPPRVIQARYADNPAIEGTRVYPGDYDPNDY